jgi:tripartite-type tricarboxylate transporter receptor subunit TctC
LAPAKTPAAIIDRPNRDMVQVLNRADVKEKCFSIGGDVTTSTPAEFAAKIRSEIAKWGKVLKDAGVRVES